VLFAVLLAQGVQLGSQSLDALAGLHQLCICLLIGLGHSLVLLSEAIYFDFAVVFEFLEGTLHLLLALLCVPLSPLGLHQILVVLHLQLIDLYY